MFLALSSVPGHLPDDEPAHFDTPQEAWDYLSHVRADDVHLDDDRDLLSDQPWRVLGALADVEDYTVQVRAMSEPLHITFWVNPDGTGQVYGDTPWIDPAHDLGLVYEVREVQ